jgi:gamma-glutamyl phosphate reductase
MTMIEIGKGPNRYLLNSLDSQPIRIVLLAMAKALEENSEILAMNKKDVEAATTKGKAALIDRLVLDKPRIVRWPAASEKYRAS